MSFMDLEPLRHDGGNPCHPVCILSSDCDRKVDYTLLLVHTNKEVSVPN